MIRKEKEIILSIIIPVYNAEKFLKKCISILANQSINTQLYEVILIDDGSIDESLYICKEFSYKYHFINYISQENSGVSSARNLGLRLAKGKYITFIDSDDYVSNNYVKTILDIINQEVDFYILNNYVGYNKYKIEKKWIKNCEYSKDNIYSFFLKYKLNAPWDKIYLNSIIKENKLRFLDGLNMGEDLIFNLEYLKYCKRINVINVAIYYHVVNVSGLCHRKAKIEHIDEFNIIFQKMIDFLKVMNLDESHEKEVYCCILRLITNFIAKLKSENIDNNCINTHLKKYNWYIEILNLNYSSKLDRFRKLLLQYNLYNLVKLIFNK